MPLAISQLISVLGTWRRWWVDPAVTGAVPGPWVEQPRGWRPRTPRPPPNATSHSRPQSSTAPKRHRRALGSTPQFPWSSWRTGRFSSGAPPTSDPASCRSLGFGADTPAVSVGRARPRPGLTAYRTDQSYAHERARPPRRHHSPACWRGATSACLRQTTGRRGQLLRRRRAHDQRRSSYL